MVESGIVFDIQRYSIHDGPGIRTVVFLKGCPLRCLWCANPESLCTAPQLYYAHTKCVHCGACVAAAPGGAITMDADRALHIDFDALNAHGDFGWVSACPTGALSVKGQAMTAGEVMDVVLRDEPFYRASQNGGLTLSGGEPLLQADFALALLQRAKACVLSTAVETTGNVPFETLERVLPYTDLFLYDMKQADNEKHKACTGVPNTRIIENLKRLAGRGANILVRTPLIPGHNDSDEDLAAMLALLKDAGVAKYALLPFHQYGSGKYASTGAAYTLGHLTPPSEERVAALRQTIADQGFTSDY